MRARENPFVVERVAAVPFRLQGPTWPELMGRLQGLRYRAAIVGPEGRGKTTLLGEIGRRLEELGFRRREVRLQRGQRHLSRAARRELGEGIGGQDVLLVDGAQELSWWAWRRLLRWSRHAGGLVVTSHRPGLLPTVFTCDTSPELLQELLDELAPRGTHVVPPALELFRRHQGNLRTALLEAYDRCAGWSAGAQEVPVPARR